MTEFETKADKLVDEIDETISEESYVQYEKFLDTELNRTYKKLMHSLDKTAQQNLEHSQKSWLKYHNAEALLAFHFYVTFDKLAQHDRDLNNRYFLDHKLFTIRNRVSSLLKYLKENATK